MAKRMSKAEMQGIFWLAVIGFPIYWVTQLGESVGWGPLIVLVVTIIGLVIWYQAAQTKKRREELMNK